MNIQQLTTLRGSYIAGLRQFCRDQKTLWQQVPWMALQADGRTGWSEDFARAYRDGFWTINRIHVHSYLVGFVDLATGELVGIRPGKSLTTATALDDEFVLQTTINDIDAAQVIGQIQKAVMAPLTAYSDEGNAKNNKERDRLIEATGLLPGVLYQRRQLVS